MNYNKTTNYNIQKDGVPFDINNDVLSGFIYLLSRHPAIIKNATFVIRMEWNDISTEINANKKKDRPQSPWGAIPSLSIPADPTIFVKHIWPNCSFQLQINDDIKQYLKNNADKLTVIHLKALDLASIAMYGLSRKDESDKWLIRYYQKYGDVILNHQKQQNGHNHKYSYCNLKTCLSYHRICILMHLHGKWTENLMMMENYENADDQKENMNDDVTQEKSIRLLKYTQTYLSEDFDAELAFNDIYHIQQKHIDFWVNMDESKLSMKKSRASFDGDDANNNDQNGISEDESREILARYQDIRQFCRDMNETRAEFCGEFVCGLMKSSDIQQIEKETLNAKNNKSKMIHPTMLPMNNGKGKRNRDHIDSNDLNELCVALHKNMFHGYSLFHALKQYRVKASKINPDRLRKQEAAIRADLQNKLRQKMQAKMRQKTY